MFDKPRACFLNSCHFGVTGTGGPRRNLAVLPLLIAVTGLGGCSPQPASVPVEDSQTSGRISIVCPPEAGDLVLRERNAFLALYPQASIELRPGPSRQAVADLFAARVDLAVITRELDPEERSAAARGGLELEGYRFARDAVAVLVNTVNPVENLSLQDLSGIYAGGSRNWSDFGGPALAIKPVAQPPRSDLSEFFVQEVLDGQSIQVPSFVEPSDSAVVERVKREPGAIGFVTLSWADRGAKALRIAGMTGLPYYRPDLETVFKGDYPLTRFYNFYVRADGPRLAGGFVTFVTSHDGQRLVKEAGLVPTTVPVRFVRRSPMQRSH